MNFLDPAGGDITPIRELGTYKQMGVGTRRNDVGGAFDHPNSTSNAPQKNLLP